ncbi:MAG: hypothetical protein SFU86_01520 [Pirellulaceae bacterium]|nr:hypothetical protein [Pirellulaceae bacterium]
MSVRCAKCGEELLGAVNRCWKCGQQFIARPTIAGEPPAEEALAIALQPALEARVLDEAPEAAANPVAAAAPTPIATGLPVMPPPKLPSLARPVPASTNLAALGGTVATVVLGVFALALAWWRFEAAIVGLVGLVMGVWGLYSSRRGWALVGMLLCCLAIVLGTITGVLQLNHYLNRNAPIELPTTVAP